MSDWYTPAGISDDRRATPSGYVWGYVCFTDSFMSGWGPAPTASYYCLAVASPKEAEIVLANGKGRSDMTRGRITSKPSRARAGCHVAIVDREEAGRWYEPGAWSAS